MLGVYILGVDVALSALLVEASTRGDRHKSRVDEGGDARVSAVLHEGGLGKELEGVGRMEG